VNMKEEMRKRFEHCLNIFAKKNEQYGNFFFNMTLKEAFQDLNRKFVRIKNIINADIISEDLFNNLDDLSNYAQMMRILAERRNEKQLSIKHKAIQLLSFKQKLNLGCGRKILKDYINIDKQVTKGIDLVLNLEYEDLPFPDNSIDEILAEHLLEHIENIYHLMNECWRVLKPNCLMKITVPRFPTMSAVNDPTHKRFFCEDSWKYYSNDYVNKYYSNPDLKCNFVKVHMKIWGEPFKQYIDVHLKAVKENFL